MSDATQSEYKYPTEKEGEERTKVRPDELGKGFQDYVKLKLEHVVYDFMCTYVRRINPTQGGRKY